MPLARNRGPLLLLAALVCVFYTPQLISGTVQFDGVDVHYSSQRYFADAIHAGHLPFWTPYLFAGFPFLADLQVAAWYPLNWPFFLVGIGPHSMSGELLLHGLIACGGAYALAMRQLGGNRPAAVATAIFYGLSGYFAAHAQHVGMVQTAAWLPWLLVLLDLLGERLSVRRLALASLLGAALALPGHFQVALYAFCGAAVWAILDAFIRRVPDAARRRAVGLLTLAGGGALLSAVMILPATELVGQSLRSQLDVSAVDIGYFHPGALITLVQPDYYGLLSGNYRGPGDSTQHYFYAGIVLVPLVLLGLRQAPVRRMALLLGLPFLWYALGPVGGLFRLVVLLPGFRSVELPMHGWFLPGLGLALLGGAGFGILEARLKRHWLATLLLLVMFGDVFSFNELQNPLAYARGSFDALYGAPLRAFSAQVGGGSAAGGAAIWSAAGGGWVPQSSAPELCRNYVRVQPAGAGRVRGVRRRGGIQSAAGGWPGGDAPARGRGHGRAQSERAATGVFFSPIDQRARRSQRPRGPGWARPGGTSSGDRAVT